MSVNGWAPHVPLGEVLRKNEALTDLEATTTYKEVTVRLWGNGVKLRRLATGAEIAGSRRSVVRARQFIVSKIDARNGAMGLVPIELDGAVVSNDFPSFDTIKERLLPEYVGWLSRTREFVESCRHASEGTTNRVRLKEQSFLRLTIPLPQIIEQRRIVAKLERLAAQINEAQQLRSSCTQTTHALLRSEYSAVFCKLKSKYAPVRLKELTLHADYGTSVKCRTERTNGDIPILRIPNVASETINLTNLKFAALDEREQRKVLLTSGDLLVVRTNGSADLVGRCAVVDAISEPCGFASYLIRIKGDSDRIVPDFLQRSLRNLRNEGALFDFARTTAGQFNVSLGRLNTAEIPLPPVAEQPRIVAYLDGLQEKVDDALRHQEKTAIELNALIPSILDRAFRGEL